MLYMAIFFTALGAFTVTFLGGIFALRFKDKLHLILGFSAGAVIGVVFFDLLPEAIELAGQRFETSMILSVAAVGFILYMIFDRLILFHGHHADNCNHPGVNDAHPSGKGDLGAASLALHSFLDGVVIGFALKVSALAGVMVTFAVLFHNFCDGINVVNLILLDKGRRKRVFAWLGITSLAPVLGILFTFMFSIPESTLGIMIGLFGGFFLYIGASELLPESHHSHPTRLTTLMTLLGIGTIYMAVKISGI